MQKNEKINVVLENPSLSNNANYFLLGAIVLFIFLIVVVLGSLLAINDNRQIIRSLEVAIQKQNIEGTDALTNLKESLKVSQNRQINLACRERRGEVERAIILYGKGSESVEQSLKDYLVNCSDGENININNLKPSNK